MKRPNMVPSSSYRENTKTVGCMSGIFQLVCKYHHNRKSLTFGKKKKSEKNIVINSSTKPDHRNKAMVQQPPIVTDRTPIIPTEIRCSNDSPENFTPSPTHSVVARLMGLTSASPESTSEKRRKLMGALEKCDQDLKALKKIIDSVRPSDIAELRPDSETETKTGMSENEQPSPVSVLDELTRSPTLSQTRGGRPQSNEYRFQHQEKKKTKSVDEDMIFATPISLFDRILKATTMESIPATLIKRPDNDADMSWPCTMKMTLSRGMVESVEQVCKDIVWGQNREVGKIGLALQEHICRDLIEEMVKEQLGVSYPRDIPRFEACRRSLRF